MSGECAVWGKNVLHKIQSRVCRCGRSRRKSDSDFCRCTFRNLIPRIAPCYISGGDSHAPFLFIFGGKCFLDLYKSLCESEERVSPRPRICCMAPLAGAEEIRPYDSFVFAVDR